jgi:mRNA-degrading endonuclease RelE of RelBE toxin-antitoxin system
MAYEIGLARSAGVELKEIRVYDRRRIVDEMREQLKDEPINETRRRKILGQVEAGFEHIAPLWELRVGDYRVFYDVDSSESKVYVRAIRRKGAEQTTEEIIK